MCIRDRIKEYRKELDHKFAITFGRHVRDLQKIRDEALQNGAYSAAVQAEYRRGQAQGDIYVNKSEIRHGTIDSMSKAEVLQALKEIKESYQGVTIDVDPQEVEATDDSAEERERILPAVQSSGEEAGPQNQADAT